jgi:hypothetical protein
MTELSKPKFYQLIAAGDIEAAKVGRATVIFVESLRATITIRAERRSVHAWAFSL